MVLVTDKQYAMDGYLKSNLDVLVRNIKKDWFFMIIVSGSGSTRIGKSVFAGQIAYYLSHQNGRKFTINEYYMNGKEMMEKSIHLPKLSAFVYDEAKAGLDSKRAMESITKNLLDFFAEAGQLNLIPIIVIPDFFDLKKEIAVTQSVALINCYTAGEFQRGFFSFYNKNRKSNLYYKGRMTRNYFIEKPNFRGSFSNTYVVDEQEYREKKRVSLVEAIKGRVDRKTVPVLYRKWLKQRNVAIRALYYLGKNQVEIARLMRREGFMIDQTTVGDIVNEFEHNPWDTGK